MFFPETDDEGWSASHKEDELLALREDCHERMEGTLKRLRALVAQTPCIESERQFLLCQLSHIQQHLRESINLLRADRLLRNN